MNNWDKTIFNNLSTVNHLLQNEDMPREAIARLNDIQDCLCSGNGQCSETAFRAASEWLRNKIVSLLGLEKYIVGYEESGAIQLVSLQTNPYGLRGIYFRG